MTQKQQERTSIDWSVCMERAAEHENVAFEMLSEYVKRLPEALETIQAAFRKQDIDGLYDQVHHLHSATCYTGVPKIRETLTQIETSIKQQKLSGIEPLLKQLDRAIDDVISLYSSHEFQTTHGQT